MLKENATMTTRFLTNQQNMEQRMEQKQPGVCLCIPPADTLTQAITEASSNYSDVICIDTNRKTILLQY